MSESCPAPGLQIKSDVGSRCISRSLMQNGTNRSQQGTRAMILYPAIDLKDGQAVRLLKGDMDKATVFNDDPAAQAEAFVRAGCEWLHLVDLNGAFAGTPVNAAPVESILRRCPVPRSEEHTSELQSLRRTSYAVFCLKKKKEHPKNPDTQRSNK